MSRFFEAGGFGMYPALVFGVLAVGAALALLFRPGARFLPLVMTLGGTTLGAGLLGFCAGLLATLEAIELIKEPGDRFHVLTVGLGESLHPLLLALGFAVVAGLVAAAGSLRSARLAPAS